MRFFVFTVLTLVVATATNAWSCLERDGIREGSVTTGEAQMHTIVDKVSIGGVRDDWNVTSNQPNQDPDYTTDIWDDYECQELNNCPAGFARRLNGAYAGCTKWPTGCTGKCEWCTGSTSPGSFCVQVDDEQCFVHTHGGSVPCGTITYWDDCVYSATQPAGEPFATPNKCYCSGTLVTSTDPCSFLNCNGT